ncbi:MAG: aminotransferase class IV, partial [Chloroflexota bacterium]|nr:aminotransferase class IV [Chloroflexota bacterium]
MTGTLDDVARTQPHGARVARSAEGGDGRRLQVGGWAYFEGRLVPFHEANVSIATHALNYGTAVFEGIRAYRQHDGELAILFAREHYQRLLRNARLIRASVSESADELVQVTRELLRRNGEVADLYVRPLLYKSAPSVRLQLSGLEDRIAIYSFPLGDYVATEGLRVTLSAWQRVNDNAVPARGKITGSYVNACLAVEDAKAGGYAEAILLTSDGHVAEASSANLF